MTFTRYTPDAVMARHAAAEDSFSSGSAAPDAQEGGVAPDAMLMISLFDWTTTMAQPWAEAGFVCYCVDSQHAKGENRQGNIVKVGADIRDWLPPRGDVAFVAAFPPCTDVAVSGAKHFRDKGLGALLRAVELFKRTVDLAELIAKSYLIEQPVSTISSYWRKPDHIFDPWHFTGYEPGDNYTKRTCLWTGGGFVMPERYADPLAGKPDNRIHVCPPGPERANFRSATPKGFARAVFEANHGKVIA